MPCQGPGHVLTYQLGRIARAPAERGDDAGRGRRVAECDGDVAQPTLVADAADGGAFGAVQEFRFGPGEQLDEFRRIERVARGKVGFGGLVREAVPWTN